MKSKRGYRGRTTTMARSPTGQIIERRGKSGTVYALRFRAYGRREYVTLGGSKDGWTRKTAEEELDRTLAAVKLGVWQPPKPLPVHEPKADPTFHEFASEWLEMR